MFHEIDPALIKQPSSVSKKRWFRDADAECDLFLWQDEKDKLHKFQFWYRDALIEWDVQTGIRTGHIDLVSGSFVHYHSVLFRLHHNLDQEIIQGVNDLLNNKNEMVQTGMNQVQDVLHEIANRNKK
jgi:hypothetical protein